MSRPRLRRLFVACFASIVVAGLALGAVLVLPERFVPERLAAPRSDAATVAELETRTLEHFDRVALAATDGGGLALPFPEMPTRAENPTTPEKVELGRLLYFDPILSGDDSLSCAHCHHPDLGLSDNRGRSMGRGGAGVGPERAGGAVLRRGSPTVWNAAFAHRQFWDGRARDLEEQATKPILDPNEMAEEAPRLVSQLASIPEYVERFDAVFAPEADERGAGLDFQNVAFAIAAFERTLVSQNSRFDRYARGERSELSQAERRGLNVFRSLETRCFECHNLPTFANADFKVIGVPGVPNGPGPEPDLGRAEIEGGAAYERAFKVPTLRNVALTAPYMHNGRFETLSEVIDFYAGGGGAGEGLDLPNLDDKIRPFSLDPREKRDLIAFLHALTDESAKPKIPASVPSGLPVVPSLPNQSPELAAFEPVAEPTREVSIRRQGNRLFVDAGQRIQDAIDRARPGDVVEVAPGTYHETLTLDVSDLVLVGRVGDGERAVLDGRGLLSDGAVGSGSRLEIRGFEVRDYTANGLMINLGADVTFRDLRLVDTGLYGVYPVEVVGVVVEDCEVIGSRDAGIYVGQSRDIVVRNNVAHGNVTGIEIENSIDALVEGNHVYGNTGGILVFGLPNNPSKIARGTRVVRNRVIENNHENFADPTAIVAAVPSGTGIMVLAGDDTEIAENEIVGHRSFGIAVAGLDMLFGAGSTYDMDPYPDRTWIHSNTLENNGFDADALVVEAGFSGADLLWDLTGEGNRFDQPGASALPPVLPSSGWSEWRRRANGRLWRLASVIAE